MKSGKFRQLYYDLVTMQVVDIDAPNVPVAIQAGFYVVMSQYFKNVRIAFGSGEKDVRLSYFEIEPSRSGKGERMKVMKKLLEALDLSWVKITRVTEAGVIGSVNEKALEYNYKNNLKEGDKTYKNPIIIGDLGKYDVIFFEEAKKLLLMGEQHDMLGDLQEALDYPGHIRKKLKNGAIEYFADCSLYCTTYYTPEIGDTLLKQGFFQRVIFRIREFTIAENRELRRRIIELFNTNKDRRGEFEEKLKEYSEMIKKLSRDSKTLYMTKSAIRYMLKIQTRFEREIKKAKGIELQIMMSFSQNVIDLCAKIGAINACLENRKKIDEADINSAYIFVKASANSILNKVMIQKKDQSSDIKDKLMRLFRKYYVKDQEINKEKFVKFLINENIGIGRNKILNIINSMIQENYFDVETTGKNEQILHVNQG